MKKKVRVDFVSHTSIVVEVETDETDNYLDRAADIAEEYVRQRSITANWEIEDGGVDDAYEDDEVDVREGEL